MGKTGTTSIQSFLSRNRIGLTDAGILYPRTPGLARHLQLGLFFQPDNRLHTLPAWRRLGYRDPQAFRTTFQRQLFDETDGAGSSRVLLSDEGLYGLPDESLRDLGGFVRRIGGTVRVVLYLRRQDDHLVSHYQQVVKRERPGGSSIGSRRPTTLRPTATTPACARGSGWQSPMY
jgi:hypothetical protein